MRIAEEVPPVVGCPFYMILLGVVVDIVFVGTGAVEVAVVVSGEVWVVPVASSIS